MKSHQLERIINNKVHGSSELVLRLNDYFLSIYEEKALLLKSIQTAKVRLGHFEAVNSYLRQLKKHLKSKTELLNFLKSHSSKQIKETEVIFRKIYPLLKRVNAIIILSRSRTVLEVLKLWHRKKKNVKVIVCESRPKLEGRLIAESLAATGVNTELITDAMMGIYIQKADAAIIGADLILNNGNIVNKTGSKILSVLCKEYNKPFYVVASRSKISKRKKFIGKNENPDEVWQVKKKNLSVRNIYFEEVERQFITEVITD